MSAYPEVLRDDPTMGAWQLLRRNNQYAQGYADWYHRIKDVPPVPFPRMSSIDTSAIRNPCKVCPHRNRYFAMRPL